jgi:hypothetical protein
MPSPLEFLMQYRALKVNTGVEVTATACRLTRQEVQLKTYFMMDWFDEKDKTVPEEQTDFNHVTAKMSSGKTADAKANAKAQNEWFKQNSERIKTAAMGKGAPQDYELALEWAIRSGRVKTPTAAAIQTYCDQRMGIDCSGFVTNYLCAAGLRAYSAKLLRGTNAQSYYNEGLAINDSTQIRQGDLLVWMRGNRVKTGPGHIGIVQSYIPACLPAGNMEVCEATGNGGATPKLLNSRYHVTKLISKGDKSLKNQVMILEVTRHGSTGDRVCVIRPAAG